MREKLLFILIGLSLYSPLRGQDFQFSQFYAAPLYLNPAMTGATELSRAGANYRKQWPGLSNDFTAYSAYFDHYSIDMNSGFGISANSFQESNQNINTSEVSLFYSYKLEVSTDFSIRFGGQSAVVRRSARLDRLVFGDQIDLFSQTINPDTQDNIPDFSPYTYLDLSFGTLMSGESFFIGLSAHHINQPNLSFFPGNGESLLPVKWSLHGGYSFPLGTNDWWGTDYDNQLTLQANYKTQGAYQQLDLGMQMLYGSFIGGLGYRGFPSQPEVSNQESIIFLLGVKLDTGLVIGYSYDFMLSPIGQQAKGAHEVSIRYIFHWGDPKSRGQKSRINKCFHYMM